MTRHYYQHCTSLLLSHTFTFTNSRIIAGRISNNLAPQYFIYAYFISCDDYGQSNAEITT